MKDSTAKTLMSILAAGLFFWVLTFARAAIERLGGFIWKRKEVKS